MLKSKVLANGVLLALVVATGLPAASTDSRLADAMQRQDETAFLSLMKGHADVNGFQPDRTTALMWAAHYGNLEAADQLLRAGADVKAVNRYGTSAIVEAASGQSSGTALLEKLLKAGADPNTVSGNNESVLMLVALTGNVDAAKILLDRGANINARDSEDQETPLMYATAEGHAPMVKFLIEHGAEINARAHTLDLPKRPNPTATFAARITGGFSALTFAARGDCVECAKLLFDAGADPNVPDREGMTPLIVAALNGSFATAAVILNHGADPNDGSLWETMDFRNFKEDTHVDPVMRSALDPLSFAKMLLDHGADPTKPYGKQRMTNRTGGTNLGRPTNTSAMDRALESVDVDSLRLMLAACKERNIKYDADAILMAAIRGYNVVGPQVRPGGEELGKLVFRTVTANDVSAAIATSVEYGADVNAKGAGGATALHIAAQQGADDVVRMLVAKGAKVDVKNDKGLTPLDYAMGKGPKLRVNRGGDIADEASEVHESTVALLKELMAGASPTAMNQAPAPPK